MSKVSIKGKKGKVEGILKEMLRYLQPGTNTISGINNIIHFEYSLLVLSSLLNIAGYEELSLRKRKVIHNAIFRLASYKNKTFNYFKKAVEVEVHRLRKQTREKFFVVFPALVNPDSFSGIQDFTLKAGKVNVKNLKKTQQKFDIQTAFKQSIRDHSMRELLRILPRITYFVVDQQAISSQDALSGATEIVNLLRAIINFFLCRGTYHLQGGRPGPLAYILPSPYYYVFDRNGVYKDFWFEYPYPSGHYVDPKHITTPQINKIQGLIGQINRAFEEGNLAKEVLEPMIRSYGSALDQIDRCLVFLYFWQSLEFLVLRHKNHVTDDQMKRRVKSLLRNDLAKDTFDYLYKRRTSLVHRGRFDVRLEDEINALKSICGISISFLLANINSLKDWKALEFYFENMGFKTDEISLKIDVLKQMINE